MYASGFLLTLCCNRFSFDVSERIFDIFLNEGWEFIIRVILGLLKLCKGIDSKGKNNYYQI